MPQLGPFPPPSLLRSPTRRPATVNLSFLHQRPIFLSGIPRTGSSWTAEMLARGGVVRYLYEPLTQTANQRPPREHQLQRYLKGDSDAPDYAAVWDELLSMRNLMRRRYLLARTPSHLRYAPVPQRLLIKEVSCSLALEWIETHLRAQIVVLLRHPCGSIASGLRMQKAGHWVGSLDALLGDEGLMRDYFEADRDWLRGLPPEPLEQMAAIYGMTYKVVGQQLERHPEWTVVTHRSLCLDPVGVFRRLFEAVDLPFGPKVEQHLCGTTGADQDGLFSLSRVSSEEPDKWKRELTPGQIDRVAEIVARFRLPFYRDFA
jgi:hypothetical protein